MAGRVSALEAESRREMGPWSREPLVFPSFQDRRRPRARALRPSFTASELDGGVLRTNEVHGGCNCSRRSFSRKEESFHHISKGIRTLTM